MTRLSTARRRLFDASSRRVTAVNRRGRWDASIGELNQEVARARDEVRLASDALRAILAQPENPEPDPGG